MQPRSWVFLGALLAGLGVAAGALGAHGLEQRLAELGVPPADVPRRLANYETAVRYQMYHAAGLLFVGLVAARRRSAWAYAAGFLFVAGTGLFSGFLYGWVLTGQRFLAHVVPLGGVAMIADWFALALAGWQLAGQPEPASGERPAGRADAEKAP